MIIRMSPDAEGDGAWGTVLNQLRGFTFEVTKTDQTFVIGIVRKADDFGLVLNPVFKRGTHPVYVDAGSWDYDKEVVIPLDRIEEMEYV